MHSQLNVQYPQSPWLWNNNNNIYETYNCRSEENPRSKVLKKIIDIIYNNKSNITNNTNDEYDYKVVKIISDLTSDNLNNKNDSLDKNHHFHFSTQNIPRKDLNSHIFLNFHTTLYCSDVNPYINREYSTELKWCILPLSCKIDIHIPPVSRNIVSNHFNISSIVNNNDEIEDNRHILYNDNILDIRNNRICKRNFIKRKIKQTINKNDNTRNIENTYTDDEKQIDVFKFIDDTLSIKNINGILKFTQLTTGKIKINIDETENTINFITVILYDNKVHITLHTINII